MGHVRRKSDELILKASKPRNAREYPAVMMRYIGLRKRRSLHTLVALAFVGPPPFKGYTQRAAAQAVGITQKSVWAALRALAATSPHMGASLKEPSDDA